MDGIVGQYQARAGIYMVYWRHTVSNNKIHIGSVQYQQTVNTNKVYHSTAPQSLEAGVTLT